MSYSFLTDYITGDRFKACANIAFDSDPSVSSKKILTNTDRVWCKTDYLDQMFIQLSDRIKPCVLITHNSDYPITEARFANRPFCIYRWYAQNVDFEHPILIPIPIGTENMKTPKGYSGDMSVIDKQLRGDHERKHLVLLNINQNTNPQERKQVVNIFCDKPWVLHSPYPAPFRHIMDLTRRSKFVFCPPGNGLDTHRVWEALYLGAIPIVKNCVHYRAFRDLPILMVNEWWEVTEEMLNNVYAEYQTKTFCEDKLKMSYWKRIIKECLSAH